jgi:hypothetical protein
MMMWEVRTAGHKIREEEASDDVSCGDFVSRAFPIADRELVKVLPYQLFQAEAGFLAQFMLDAPTLEEPAEMPWEFVKPAHVQLTVFSSQFSVSGSLRPPVPKRATRGLRSSPMRALSYR